MCVHVKAKGTCGSFLHEMLCACLSVAVVCMVVSCNAPIEQKYMHQSSSALINRPLTTHASSDIHRFMAMGATAGGLALPLQIQFCL